MENVVRRASQGDEGLNAVSPLYKWCNESRQQTRTSLLPKVNTERRRVVLSFASSESLAL